jgi:TolB-like protein/Tfp pilus assembly protein PilF
MTDLLNGEFRLGKRLGGGAEGDVYEAVSVKTNQKVAVKIIKRPRQDGELLASIRKLKGNFLNSCAAVLDVFEADGKIVTVLELVDGVPLREFLASNDWSSAKRQVLGRELLRSVKELHDEGLAHGDLSPDNVFVSPAGKIKLIDPRISVKQPAGAVFGTANYTAPEMLVFDSVANACGDAFSVAALLFEIFEGQDPFGCRSPEEYVLKAGTKSLAVRPFQKTPASFRPLITAGLEFDPRARAKTVARLQSFLEAPGRRKRVAALIGGLLLALLIGRALSSRSGAAIDSIAVLPFVDQNHDPETEYLSDGLTESIINGLAQLPDVRVSPRGVVFRYKGSGTDPMRVARDLGVRAVLTGRLMRRGDRLLVSVELLDARDNKQVWGERYDWKAAAALDLQREISQKIFESLRAKMTGETQRRLAKRGTESPEAYQAYLKGRYYWNRRTALTIGKALEQFQQAVDADPAYALAHIGLADCYAVLQQYAGVPASETLPKARAAALRALEIDDSLSEAHASLGYVDMMSWQFDEADKEFKRAIALDPKYPTASMWYGTFLNVTGKLDEALPQSRRAQQLDPLSAIASVQVCNLQLLKGDLVGAIDGCKKVLELDEKFPRAHDLLGWAYLKQGRAPAAMVELKKAVDLSGRASQELGYLGYGYGKLNRRADAAAILKELEQRYAKRQSPGMFLAAVYAGLGDKDQAFAWLEKDFRERSGTLVYITYFPVYDTLRDDPRYKDLLRRMVSGKLSP